MEKSSLREKYKAIRHNVSYRLEKEKKIINKVLLLDRITEAKVIGIYISFMDEVDTIMLIEELKKRKKTIAVPKINKDLTMDFYCLDDLHELKKNKYGILEPTTDIVINSADIDILIIPGIVFDTNKNRIGFGKGFYDRYLQKSEIYKVGLCFDEQISDEIIDVDEFDIKMDLLVSDKRII